ncbi:hypothetical protein AMAG_04104 [Allomyces macrogynus ATCC 38327]|uniref:Uncharacterized protein n=1 Tax=Allomyces macrogynus (strain ATCC 38327) TaxID=578462 RepID=A0A0L0S7I3_ALLM3|nr:hypothetical protein AMAG_04104 [Allomyces macrogynus ATCC 38327]|eukprot:KNE58538.1 hypothetical protein AMAG_04104 [Allomyces macrogynus ATCC 38327]
MTATATPQSTDDPYERIALTTPHYAKAVRAKVRDTMLNEALQNVETALGTDTPLNATTRQAIERRVDELVDRWFKLAGPSMTVNGLPYSRAMSANAEAASAPTELVDQSLELRVRVAEDRAHTVLQDLHAVRHTHQLVCRDFAVEREVLRSHACQVDPVPTVLEGEDRTSAARTRRRERVPSIGADAGAVASLYDKTARVRAQHLVFAGDRAPSSA